MRFATVVLLIAVAGVSVFGQAPTLFVKTDDPNLPSELFYGTVKVKPLRVRPGTNPPVLITIADTDFFVQEHYIDFLNRMPDQSGFGFWTGEIDNCAPKPSCTEIKRINASAAFFISIEFQQTGYLVERLYRTAYGEGTGTSTFGGAHQLPVPVVQFSEFMPDTKTIGQGVIVNQTGWEQILENNKQAFTLAFVQRARFTDPAAFPTSMSPTAFVDKLNTNAGNVLSSSERDTAIALFGSATDTSNTTARSQAIRQIAEDSDLKNAEFNKAFVLMQYFGYLRRDPNSGPDTDHTGYDFWLTKLNQFNGNFVNSDMVKSFLVSGEYINRF